jgi:hypothetical protein
MTTRREQMREVIARHRKRRKLGLFWRPILVTKDQLDQRFYSASGRSAPSVQHLRQTHNLRTGRNQRLPLFKS